VRTATTGLRAHGGFIGYASGEPNLSTTYKERRAFLALCDQIGRKATARGLTRKKLAKLLSDE
jgi:hypothetical protein